MYTWPMDMDNRVGIDCGSGGGMGTGEQKGKNWDNYNRTTVKYLLKNNKVTANILPYGLSGT